MTSDKKFYPQDTLETKRKWVCGTSASKIFESDRDYREKKVTGVHIDFKQMTGDADDGAFPYVFQHFKVVGQSIPFFIIFMIA